MAEHITHYEVNISDSTGIVGIKNEFNINKRRVIAENDEYLVIDDLRFTTIKKGFSDWEEALDNALIILHANDKVWGNRIHYSLYTEKSVKAETIREAIEQAVKDKYGFFIGTLNLDIVKD